VKPKYRVGLFLNCSLVLVSQIAQAECPSFTSARSAYASQNTNEAIRILECLIHQNPKDYDSRRLLSDLFWWEGHYEKSKKEAQSVLSEIQTDTSGDFDEMEFFLKHRVNRFRLSGNLDYFNAASGSVPQTGMNWKGELTYRTKQASEFRVGYSNLQRVFKDGTNINNQIFNLGKLHHFSKSFYLDTNLTYSNNAVFSPLWSVYAEPHWVTNGGSDFSLGSSFSQFTGDLKVMEFRGGVIQSLSSLPFNVGARLSSLVVFSDEILPAANVFTEWLANYRMSIRADIGGGRALESPGLKNGFITFAVSSRYWFSHQVGLRAGLSHYNAQFRTEDRLTVGMEIGF
jgi:hypothetical protein